MVELKHDELHFSFPEVHEHARLSTEFQRTLRIPDDGKTYPLPPGLGAFPQRHVDDFRSRVPSSWREHGGVMMPMYQSEALWLRFSSFYPFAVRIAAGKIDAVSGKAWAPGLHRDPQDYVIVPEQPWLDGFCVEKGVIRQFVAMPLGSGYSVEEQLTGKAEHGGIQIHVYPIRPEHYHPRLDKWMFAACYMEETAAMGLAPGGKMKQEIFADERPLEVWDTAHSSRCFVHLANSLTWRAITGENPPTTPFTAKEYTNAGLPWFDYYGGDLEALEGSPELAKAKSVVELAIEKDEVALPENESVTPERVIQLRKRRGDEVRVGEF